MICISRKYCWGNNGARDGRGVWDARQQREVCTFQSVNLNGQAVKLVFDQNIRRYAEEEVIQLNRC